MGKRWREFEVAAQMPCYGGLSLSGRRELCPHFNDLSLLVLADLRNWRTPVRKMRPAGRR